jgi:hypothetical protein
MHKRYVIYNKDKQHLFILNKEYYRKWLEENDVKDWTIESHINPKGEGTEIFRYLSRYVKSNGTVMLYNKILERCDYVELWTWNKLGSRSVKAIKDGKVLRNGLCF